MINKKEETLKTNDSSHNIDAHHSHNYYHDARLSGGFLEYALRHVLMIDSATPFIDISSRECSDRKEEEEHGRNLEEEEDHL